jgi:hypothetical protein
MCTLEALAVLRELTVSRPLTTEPLLLLRCARPKALLAKTFTSHIVSQAGAVTHQEVVRSCLCVRNSMYAHYCSTNISYNSVIRVRSIYAASVNAVLTFINMYICIIYMHACTLVQTLCSL